MANGEEPEALIPLGTKVRVQESTLSSAWFEATLQYFVPYGIPSPSSDIAILSIPDEEITGAGAVPFSAARPKTDAPVRLYGHPYATGGWLKGSIGGIDLADRIQFDKNTFGVPLKGGLSGSPVWSEDLTSSYGMISVANEESGVGFLIPYRLIRNALESIGCIPRIASSSPHEVAESLLQLDFHPQLSSSKNLADEHRCAILIGGAFAHGQQVLAKRIARYWNFDNAKILRVDLSDVHDGSYADFLEQLGQDLNVPFGKRGTVDPLYRALTARLRVVDSILLIRTGERTPGTTIRRIVEEFWPNLVSMVDAAHPPNRLLLLMLDKRTKGTGWKGCLVASSADQWRSNICFEIPLLDKIAHATIQEWLLQATGLGGAIKLRLVADALFARSDSGIPERLFQEYCAMRGATWTAIRKNCELG